jgi:Major tropism determinant N-terminal domain
MPRQTNIQIRRGAAAAWASTNPTLAAGEIAMETDTRKIKVGDGSTAWNSLQYVRADGGDLDAGAGGGNPTTTAAPTTTTTAAPTTTTTAAPTTTTTAGLTGVFRFSGAGYTPVNGCYIEAGYQKDGKQVYVNNSNSNVRVAWSGDQSLWLVHTNGNTESYDYRYFGGGSSASPTNGWNYPLEFLAPAPTQTIGCS